MAEKLTRSALLMAVFAVRQFKLEVPLVKITVLKVGRFRATVTVNMINVAVSTGMSVMLPLFIQNLLGYSPFVTGLTMLPGALAGALVGLFAGKLFDRKGIRVCVVPGALLMAGALAAMALCFGAGTPLPVVGLLYGCMFVGLQLLNTTVGTWGLNALRNEDRDLLDGSLMMAYRFDDPESFGQRARQLLELRVESVMTRDVVCVEQGMPLGRACQLLAAKRIKKVPVVDAQGTLVGTLSRSDVVRSTLAELVAIAS